MKILETKELCGALNPLVGATCRLTTGHDGAHWGHGPTWTWDDAGMCQTVAPPFDPPQVEPAHAD